MRAASTRVCLDLRDFVGANVTTYFHPVGSCRLGTGLDAVVGVHSARHELDGLWVPEAFVMPTTL